jgi:hypothetical protein
MLLAAQLLINKTMLQTPRRLALTPALQVELLRVIMTHSPIVRLIAILLMRARQLIPTPANALQLTMAAQ